MCELRVKNFGPISEGLENDEFLKISQLTVFIGNQGTGKSTVAKLFSSFSWVEKNLYKKGVSDFALSTTKFFNNLLKFHKIDAYLKKNTEIEYIGDFLKISYSDGALKAEVINNYDYILPKIQYIPAERNLLSVVDKYAQISYLPDSLKDFIYIYDIAVQSDCIQGMELPINNLKIRYNKRKHKVELFNADYSILLSEASSGLQSFVPFFVVIKFLSDEVFAKSTLQSFKNLEERQRAASLYEKMNKTSVASDSELLTFAEENSKRLFNSCVLTILEEPEQNLFPSSQKDVVLSLLANANISNNNKLLLTTHSPYILPYINSAIKANELASKDEKIKDNICKIIPSESFIDSNSVNVYEFSDGHIVELKKKRGISSDENLLNEKLEETNELFMNILKAGAL